MAIFEWRKFNFFDLKSDVDRGIIRNHLPDDASITTTAYGNGQVIIGDSAGNLHVFKKDWSCVSAKAHDGPVLLSKFCRSNNLLVTIGEDSVEGCCFKVWNLSKCLREGQPPSFLRSSKIALQTPTALDISENGQLMAIGFLGGGVSLYKGDLNRDRSKSCKSLSGGLTAVTGLAFKTSGKVTLLYVCTKSDVLVYNIQSSRDRETRIVLQQDSKDKPSPIRCSTLQASGNRSFLVGRDSAIYCFDSEDMGPCYALDGVKSALECFRTYIVIVSQPTKKKAGGGSQKDFILTVIDIKNKIIVHTSPVENIAGIIIEFGSCYILTQQKEMLVLDEKDLEAKLSLLFKKNLYDIAVRVAKNSEYDSGSLAGILRTYADHLYSKNDYSGAVDQYIKTIGHLEPSYVIMKYLDSRHIDCLTTYLEALHRSGHASADHTTLLLNCFTRLDRVDEAKNFLQSDDPELKYDLDIAIQVCRTASVEHALELAKRHQRHRHCISILVEDMKEYKKALEYIGQLDVNQAEENLKRYGSELMKHCPREMTDLLKRTCAEYCRVRGGGEQQQRAIQLDSIYDPDDDDESMPKRGDPENYLHLFVDAPEYLTEFLEYLIKHLPNCSSKLVFNALVENYLEQWSNEALKSENNVESKQAEKLTGKILDLLQKHYTNIDQSQVLILCRLHDFLPGILWVYEEDELYHLIVRHYLKEGEYNKLLDTCARLGKKRPTLWLQALAGLRDDPKAPADMLTEILGVIGQEKLQSPLQVLKSLVTEGSNGGGGPQLGAVRNYFSQVFKKEEDQFKEEGESVEKYRKDGQKWKVHIENLQELPIEFKGSNCSNCSQPLTIPAVYYFCQHSFHQDCVRAYSETDSNCPVCHVKNAGIMDTLLAQQESRTKHNEFHSMLDRSPEPFSLVAEYFGRGLFNRIVIFDENNLKKTPERRSTTGQGVMSDVGVKPMSAVVTPAIAPAQRPLPGNKSNLHFGSGAEAKMRVTENRSNIIPAPQSEARMRIQEQQRNTKANAYSSSLEANIDWSVARSRAAPGNTNPQLKKQIPVAAPATVNYPKSANPFGEDDKETPGPASGSNPFGDYDVVEVPAKKSSDYNPFDEDEDVSNNNSNVDNYDNSLNPFGD